MFAWGEQTERGKKVSFGAVNVFDAPPPNRTGRGIAHFFSLKTFSCLDCFVHGENVAKWLYVTDEIKLSIG